MTKHKHVLRLKVELSIEDGSGSEIDEDSGEGIEDDTDDEDYNPNHEAKRQRRVDGPQEDPILLAMQKCHQIAKTIKDAFVASKLATNTPFQNATQNKRFVSKADVNGACKILENDATRNIKPYQMDGVNFLLLLNRVHVGGAILADEMGLGKTIQVIAFLSVLKHVDGNLGPHLIVAPVSLLENWKQEIAKWCPSFKVVVFRQRTKENLIEKFSHGIEEATPTPFTILITSYSVFEGKSATMREAREYLRMWNWSCVIMDEGHVLKDSTRVRNRRLQEIVGKAKQRIILTGTPIQNDLQELWSLLSFMMPETFDARGKNLQDYFGARNHSTQDQPLIGKMQALLKPFVLRRLKSNVLWQLQSKRHCVLKLGMGGFQTQAYGEALSTWQAYAKSKIISNHTDSHVVNNQGVSNPLTRQEISNFFIHLRKISNHPLLVRRHYGNDIVKGLAKRFYELGVFGNKCSEKQVHDNLLAYSDFALHKLCKEHDGIPNGQGVLDNKLAFSSTKCQMLANLLAKLKEEGHRCLIFSQWTMILDILEWVLTILGYRFVRLDGSTNVENRQPTVDEFNNNQDIFIFLISTRAGGQGLNLIGADTVIIHDVDFNPQIDRQAEDRCHRIGQLKPVTIYRLVTTNSVDESIYNIANKKLELDAALLQTKHCSPSNELDVMTHILLEQVH